MRAFMTEGQLPGIHDHSVAARRRSRARLLVVIGTVVMLTLAACASASDARRTGEVGGPSASVRPEQMPSSEPHAPVLPDLENPSVREAFIASFADGYFTDPYTEYQN
jgi:hypothetical protein